MYWLIFIVFLLASLLVQWALKSKMETYSKVFLPSGLTGCEVAEKMLRDNGIYDVRVVCIQGRLTDHYNPVDKTLNLSEDVYHGSSVASAAVAAHECGHAVQHAESYYWLGLRSALVPATNFCGNLAPWILFIGLILMTLTSLGRFVAVAGVVLYAVTTLFAFVTLPVEYDASHRALVWLESTGLASGNLNAKAKDALRWAARTYVVSALASLATLLYYISVLRR